MEATVQTQFHSLPTPLRLSEGGELVNARLAYETWGQLNAARDNAILLYHALSGSQHASGHNSNIPEIGDLWTEELHEGWWNAFLGPGKAIDTDKHFVICANYLGGCYGSTGPASINPETGAAYGSAFPHVSVRDQVEATHHLVRGLGIESLRAVIGPSVGGLCALTYASQHAQEVEKIILIASGMKTTVLNRLILFEQILAIENDPHFCGGDYYQNAEHPWLGLALARMISHKTFVHLDSFERRARREIVQHQDLLTWYQVRDPFQSYMLHQGKKFTTRFDANTYLRIIDMWSRFDALREAQVPDHAQLLAPSRAAGHQYLIFSIDSDFCFYPEEQIELVRQLELAQIPTTHITVHSGKGHDSFLLEPELYAPHLHFTLQA